jgi:NADPH:quinone reductase-like Zn-dependent oxidoreductase
MNISNLFYSKPSKPKPEPVIGNFVRGIIESMKNHSDDWSLEGDRFIHAPTGMMAFDCSDEDGTWTEFQLSDEHILVGTRDEYSALSRAYYTYLKAPAVARERASRLKAAQNTRNYFDRLGAEKNSK